MEKFDLRAIKPQIDADLHAQLVSGRTLLDRLRVIDESSRKSAAYLDHKYAPFYYHLGKHVPARSIMEVGFTLGLLSASLLSSCRTAEKFLGFRESGADFVPLRLGKANIRLVFKGQRDFYVGKLYDQEFDAVFSPNSWDCIILNDETVYDKHLEYLDVVWPHVSEHGLVIAEYIDRHTPAKEAFLAFCESKNRQPVVFETRYGTGIIQK